MNREIAETFESFVKARGAELRDAIFERLVEFEPMDLLDVGLQQFARHGNSDRLSLTAAVLAKHGDAALDAFRHVVDTDGTEAVYFADAIAASRGLSVEHKRSLLGKLVASEDPELQEKARDALEWCSTSEDWKF